MEEDKDGRGGRDENIVSVTQREKGGMGGGREGRVSEKEKEGDGEQAR